MVLNINYGLKTETSALKEAFMLQKLLSEYKLKQTNKKKQTSLSGRCTSEILRNVFHTQHTQLTDRPKLEKLVFLHFCR